MPTLYQLMFSLIILETLSTTLQSNQINWMEQLKTIKRTASSGRNNDRDRIMLTSKLNLHMKRSHHTLNSSTLYFNNTFDELVLNENSTTIDYNKSVNDQAFTKHQVASSFGGIEADDYQVKSQDKHVITSSYNLFDMLQFIAGLLTGLCHAFCLVIKILTGKRSRRVQESPNSRAIKCSISPASLQLVELHAVLVGLVASCMVLLHKVLDGQCCGQPSDDAFNYFQCSLFSLIRSMLYAVYWLNITILIYTKIGRYKHKTLTCLKTSRHSTQPSNLSFRLYVAMGSAWLYSLLVGTLEFTFNNVPSSHILVNDKSDDPIRLLSLDCIELQFGSLSPQQAKPLCRYRLVELVLHLILKILTDCVPLSTVLLILVILVFNKQKYQKMKRECNSSLSKRDSVVTTPPLLQAVNHSKEIISIVRSRNRESVRVSESNVDDTRSNVDQECSTTSTHCSSQLLILFLSTALLTCRVFQLVNRLPYLTSMSTSCINDHMSTFKSTHSIRKQLNRSIEESTIITCSCIELFSCSLICIALTLPFSWLQRLAVFKRRSTRSIQDPHSDTTVQMTDLNHSSQSRQDSVPIDQLLDLSSYSRSAFHVPLTHSPDSVHRGEHQDPVQLGTIDNSDISTLSSTCQLNPLLVQLVALAPAGQSPLGSVIAEQPIHTSFKQLDIVSSTLPLSDNPVNLSTLDRG